MSIDVFVNIKAQENLQVGSVVALSWKNVVIRRILNTVPLSEMLEQRQPSQMI